MCTCLRVLVLSTSWESGKSSSVTPSISATSLIAVTCEAGTVSTSTPRRCPQEHGLAVTGAAGARSPEDTEGASQPQGGCT